MKMSDHQILIANVTGRNYDLPRDIASGGANFVKRIYDYKNTSLSL